MSLKLSRHEVATPAGFGSLVPGVALLQHVTAQELPALVQFP